MLDCTIHPPYEVEYEAQIGVEDTPYNNRRLGTAQKSVPRKRLGSDTQEFLAKAMEVRNKFLTQEKAVSMQHKEYESNFTMLRSKFQPHSGIEGVTIMQSSLDTISENIAFEDQIASPVYKVDSEIDPTRKLQDSQDASLGNFLSRPIKIAEYEWSTSTTLGEAFDPWSLFCENPRVINRITNFNLMRMKLHLKVLINGNGFHYGRAILAYNPLDSLDDLSAHTSLVNADLVQTSQLPHIYLDPTTSLGGEMILPFYYHRNYINISANGWSEMGMCYLRSLNTLKHANGATDKVTITVMAWAEDVSLSVLTSLPSPFLTPQSGKEDEVDEANRKGVISGPASAIAKGARALSGISMIAPYAMATAKAADVVGGVAKMFGYCAPPITKAPDPYRPQPVNTLALTNVPQTINKLSMDEKQELTIDPRIAGLSGDDPMNIKNIASRESYLTSFPWTTNTDPEETLFNIRVSPVVWRETRLTPNSYVFPACCMAALPFKYWTGTMKYRFQIVASAFHKGRLRFSYEPNYQFTNEYNTNYNRIVDIAKEQDFTIEIGNGQEYTLLDHADPGPDVDGEVFSEIGYSNKGPGNGILTVYVLNELTTPNSTVDNDIEINVFVSAGDDFEVFVPDSKFQNFTFFAPQAGIESEPSFAPESQSTTEASQPLQWQTMKLGPGEQDISDVNKVFTGESIASFRPLLKRGNLHESQFVRASRGNNMGLRPSFPFLRGYAPGAVHITSGAVLYNYCNTVLLHWVSYAFQGRRGSIRWKVIPRCYGTGQDSISMYAGRNPIGTGIPYFHANALNDQFLGTSKTAHTVVNHTGSPLDVGFPTSGVDGSCYTNNNVNNVLEFEVPYYSRYRFSPGKEADLTTLEKFDPIWRYFISSQVNNASAVDFWCSTGEDFQVYMWTGLPRMYYEAGPPAPG